jgi:hypothetical protein
LLAEGKKARRKTAQEKEKDDNPLMGRFLWSVDCMYVCVGGGGNEACEEG